MEGASTDLGRRIRELVVDVPGGREVDLEWEDLDRVVFSAAPSGARASSGRLYGTVEDSEGRLFTGYVSYDLDEILEADVLDGRDTETGDDLDIRFSEITSIARLGRGAQVVLVDGTVLDLRGSNDVDRRNRGIQISDPTWAWWRSSGATSRFCAFMRRRGWLATTPSMEVTSCEAPWSRNRVSRSRARYGGTRTRPGRGNS